MPYTANIPTKRYFNRGNNEKRTCEPDAKQFYHDNQEGLPDSNSTIIQYLSSEAIFYSIEDVMGLTGWSRKVVQRLFNTPDFPYTDLGKKKLVESHALIAYFATKRLRPDERC